jgi:hypothetical protein
MHNKIKAEPQCLLHMGAWVGSRRSTALKVLRP